MRLAPLAIAILVALMGCGGRADLRAQYLKESEKLAEDFANHFRNANQRELPSTKGMSDKDRILFIAGMVRKDARTLKGIASAAENLNPPADLQGHKKAFSEFYSGTADRMAQYADAIASGDKTKAATAGQELETFMIKGLSEALAEAQKAGVDTTELAQKLGGVGGN
jgi:hypothetical protein